MEVCHSPVFLNYETWILGYGMFPFISKQLMNTVDSKQNKTKIYSWVDGDDRMLWIEEYKLWNCDIFLKKDKINY